MSLWTGTGIAFIFAGILELCFCALSLLGTGLGGFMTAAIVTGDMRNAEWMGPLIFVFYAVWLVATFIAGPTHLITGVMLVMGKRNRKALWAGTIVSVLPLVTVYCAPTSILAGVLGIITAVQRPEPGV